jgi:PAS domain S-box-containing protein
MGESASFEDELAPHLPMVDALQCCVLLHDAETKDILWANRAACRLLGFTVAELRPMKAPDMSSPARAYHRDIGRAWLHRAVLDGISETEWCYRSRTGEEILTEAVAIRVELPSRTVVMVQFRDIAEERAMRRDVERLNHLARYNAMGDMAMAVAHELGQPLAAASNFLAGARSRLDRGSPDARNPRDSVDPGDSVQSARFGLDHAGRQIERASAILRSLRQYVVRLEQSVQLTDLNRVLDDSRYFLLLRAEGKGVRLEFELADEPLPVRCEQVLIGQVVLNLVFNAVEEMARWPQVERLVRVTTRRAADGCAELSVADRGTGLGELLEHTGGSIFEGAFTSKEHGSGIGLALSHRIVTRHRGRIDAAENRPHGAVFTFGLPPADPSDPADPSGQRSSEEIP